MAQTFNCPSCGAPLEIDGDKTSIVCKFCGDTVAVPEEFRPRPVEASPAPVEAQPWPSQDDESPVVVPAANNNYGWAIGTIFVVGVILFSLMLNRAARPAALRPTDPGDVSASNSSAYIDSLATQEVARAVAERISQNVMHQADTENAQAFNAAATLTATYQPDTLISHRLYSPVILPADAGSPSPDFLVQDYDGYYAWADGTTEAVLWKSDPLTGHGSQARAFIVEKQALIVDLTSISALDLQTGKAAWKASLVSGLGNCTTCLVQSGNMLVVLLKDGTIQALDATSGKLTWHKTLKGTYSDIFLAGGLPALVDQDGGKGLLYILDPLTGNVSRNIQPTCLGGKKVGAVMNVVDLGAGEKELFVLGEGCVQIISLPDGKVTAQVIDRQFADHSDSIWLGNSYLVTANAVYYASASKSVHVLDLSSGASRELLADPNNDLKPLTLSGNVLVVDTRSSSDNTHLYWGIDAASGQNLWNFPVNGQANVHFLSNGYVFVYKYQLGTHEWTAINPQTGADDYQYQVISGGGLSYEFTWYKDTVYIIRDHQLKVMNALTGKSLAGSLFY